MIVGAGSKMIESAFLLFLFTVVARGDAMSQNNTDGRRMDSVADWFKAKFFEFFYPSDGGEPIAVPREIYNICNEPRMTGTERKTDGRPCEERDMFYFNSENGTCEQFVFGGCGGNGNKFSTEKECLDVCKPAGSEKTLLAHACTSMWYGKKFPLRCPNDEKVQVIRAFYGYWSWGDDHKKCGYASGDCTTDAATPACFSNDCVVTAERSSVSFSCGKWNDYMQVEYKCVV